MADYKNTLQISTILVLTIFLFFKFKAVLLRESIGLPDESKQVDDQKINETLILPVFEKKSRKVELLQTDPQSDSIDPLKSAAKNVFIAGLWRGGLSFLGEIFNRNPHAIYLFEPDSMQSALSDKTSEGRYTHMVKYFSKMFKSCVFTDPVEIILADEKGRENVFFGKSNQARLCLQDGVCFRKNSRKLFGTCKGRYSYKPGNGCGRLNFTQTREICEKSDVLAVKSIVLPGLDSLEGLWGGVTDGLSDASETKVILYIRDPRGLFNSRKRTGDTYNNYIHTCNQLLQNMEFLKKSGFKNRNSSSKNNNLFILRYEDFGTNPMNITREIYNHFGINDRGLTDVLTFLEKSTTSGPNSGGQYGTSRNSEKTVVKWMGEISWADVDGVQKECGKGIFDFFGYSFYENEYEFEKGLNGPVLEDWTFGGVYYQMGN